MSLSDSTPRIAWLVNLFGDPDAQHAHAAAALRPLATALRAQVVPVYAIDEGAEALSGVPVTERLAYTRARLTALLGANDLPPGEPVLVNPGPGASLRERVEALAAAMAETDPLFVAVHTHTYSALDRFLLGSFSEKFFQQSPCPVLVLNPHAALPGAYDRITFATDFSQNASDALQTLLPIARGLGARLRVEHQLPVRELPLFLKGDTVREQYEREITTERERIESQLTPLRVAAEAAGVSVESHLALESASTTPGEGIERRAAQAGASLLAVSAHGDQKRPGNIGSTALWLMRHAERPVLVFPARRG